MKKPFYSGSREFWLYNVIAWSVLMALHMIGKVYIGAHLAFNFIGMLIIIAFLLHACLLFRYYIASKRYYAYTVTPLILSGAAFAFFAAIPVGAIAAITHAIYIHTFAPELIDEITQGFSFLEYHIVIGVNNGFFASLFIALWCALYVGVMFNRRSREARLASVKLENSLKESQLNLLTAQLNPHFLFNALNNIRFMMREDVDNAEHMLTNLSDILRYSLQSTARDKVPLEEEMAVVKQYLMLTKVQLGERLQLKENIEADTLTMLVPPMVIQLLAENAVKHGIDLLARGGRLHIHIYVSSGALRIDVSNDYRAADTLLGGTSTGIGIENIRRRLRLLYEGHASMSVDKTDGWHSVVLSIPVDAA